MDGHRTRFTIQLNYPPRTFVGKLQRSLVVLVPRTWLIPRMLKKLKRLVEADTAVA